MGKKYTIQEINIFIEQNEDKLLSKEYKNNKQLLEIKCKFCNKIYLQNFDRYKRGYRHKKCINNNKINIPDKKNNIINKRHIIKKNKDIIYKICNYCNLQYISKRKNQIYCSKQCSINNLLKDKNKLCEWGRKGGEISYKIINNRSKGEILFYDLCCKYFGKINILSNEKIFIDKNNNKWDADIIIPKYKTCISYNGIYHYKKIHYNQNINKIIQRDKLKQKIIFDNNYIQYIVKDLNSFNKYFVYKEFHKFIFNRFIHLELLLKNNFI